MRAALRIFVVVIGLALLALAAQTLAGDELGGRRWPMIVLTVLALVWFARPSGAPAIAAFLPAGMILDRFLLGDANPIYAGELVTIGAACGLALRALQGKVDLERPWAWSDRLYLMFVLWGLIALGAGHASLLGESAGPRTLRVLLLAAAVIVIFRDLSLAHGRESVLRWWTFGALGGLAVTAAYGLGEGLMLARGDEPTSFHTGSVGLAVHIAFFAPVALSLGTGGYGRGLRTLGAAAWLGAVACLPLTASRGGLVSLAITSVAVIAVMMTRRGNAGRRGPILVVTLLVVGAAVLAINPELAGESFAYKFHKSLEGDFVSTRVDAWREARAAVEAHPLFGERPDAESKSIPLELARRHGLPGALLFLGAVLTAVVALFARSDTAAPVRRRTDEEALSVGLALGFVGLMIIGLAETGVGARTTPLVSSAMAVAGLLATHRGGRGTG